MAQIAMNNVSHLKLDINWYLINIENLKKNKDKILFVGTLETIKNDFNKLINLLEIKNITLQKVHTTPQNYKYMYKLSNIGINNIINHYKKDYDIIYYLIDNNFINPEYKKYLNA